MSLLSCIYTCLRLSLKTSPANLRSYAWHRGKALLTRKATPLASCVHSYRTGRWRPKTRQSQQSADARSGQSRCRAQAAKRAHSYPGAQSGGWQHQLLKGRMIASMRSPRPRFQSKQGLPHQRGLALMMAVMLTATVSFGAWLGTQRQAAPADATAVALDQARSALLSWSVGYYQKTGSGRRGNPRAKATALPCPDLGKSFYPGASAGVCGARHLASVGLLPWRSLGVPPLRDASGSCLWYWVSGHYKNSPYPRALNSLQAGGWIREGGRLVYHERVPASAREAGRHIAAIIIAPGRKTDGQRRSPPSPHCSHQGEPSDYIESVDWSAARISGGIDNFRHFEMAVSADGNDRMVVISHGQLWRSVLANINIARLLLEEMPARLAECAASALAAAPLEPLPSSISGLWRHERCQSRYDRRARDLEQHWSDAVRLHEMAGGVVSVGPSEALRQSMPSFGRKPGDGGGDAVEEIVAPMWFCVEAGKSEILECPDPALGESPDDSDA